MEQHPVPQNISSYQFHLVGDMTLKQFLELAGGVLVGVLIYVTGLPGIIKLPLILFSVGLGAALAFIPFEERPLEQWIIAFFRSVYSPTLFQWDRRQEAKYFADETAPAQPGVPATQTALSKIPFLSKLEESENSYLSKLTGLFSPQTSAKPVVEVTPSAPSQVQIQPANPTPVLTGTTNISNNIPSGQVLTVNTVSAPQNTNPVPIPNDNVKRQVQIPQATYVSVDKNVRPQVVVEETPQERVNLQTTDINPTLTGQKIEGQTQQAMFSADAAPPSLPTIINTISGQVMDRDKKILEGAILEIVDEANRPVRALRTNRAGHFLTVTPLTTGKYKMIVEKEGYNFEPVEFEANDTIINPMAVTAT